MHRLVALVLLLTGTTAALAATPVHHAHRHHRVSHVRRPSGAVPRAPATTESRLQPAPVPNENMREPDPNKVPTTTAAPEIVQLHYPPVGNGYPTGSSPAAMDDSRTQKVPGFNVKVPVQ